MSIRHLYVVLLATLPLLGAGCFGSGSLQHYRDLIAKEGGDRTVSTNGLALSLHPRKDMYKKPDTIFIDVKLTNVTTLSSTAPVGEINVYAELVPEGFLFTFDLFRLGKTKEQVHKSEILKIDPKEQPGHYSHYVKLQPMFYFGRPIQIDSRRLPSGIYQLVAYYTSDQKECLLSPRLTPDQIRLLETERGNEGFAKLWMGKLTSNTIVFEVK